MSSPAAGCSSLDRPNCFAKCRVRVSPALQGNQSSHQDGAGPCGESFVVGVLVQDTSLMNLLKSAHVLMLCLMQTRRLRLEKSVHEPRADTADAFVDTDMETLADMLGGAEGTGSRGDCL